MSVAGTAVSFIRKFAVSAAIACAALAANAGERPRAVLEMFTSQGCSSCPAADSILASYAAQGEVLALSWHVDYWNYLGWKDTFSKAEFTQRQRRYAQSFSSGKIYTPQAVINGRTHVVGSRGKEIARQIGEFEKAGKGLTVRIDTRKDGNRMLVTVSGDVADAEDATLWLVFFDEKRTVKIKRGENRGKNITYHNVVRDTEMLGMMKGGNLSVDLSMDVLRMAGHESCALILQKTGSGGTPGPILGATIIRGLNS